MQSGRVRCAETLKGFAIETLHNQVGQIFIPFPFRWPLHTSTLTPASARVRVRREWSILSVQHVTTLMCRQATMSLPLIVAAHAEPTARNALLLDAACEATLVSNHVAKVL